jgi:hypothetical protein
MNEFEKATDVDNSQTYSFKGFTTELRTTKLINGLYIELTQFRMTKLRTAELPN